MERPGNEDGDGGAPAADDFPVSAAATPSASHDVSRRPPPTQALWWEVLAVLSIGVIPHLIDAVRYLIAPEPPDTGDYGLGLTRSVLILVPVLWIMRSTGLAWMRFGLVRVRPLLDGALGIYVAVLLIFVPYVLDGIFAHVCDFIPWQEGVLTWIPGGETAAHGTAPQGTAEWVLAVLGISASAASEEIVCRGYLIRRLTDLTGNMWAGVVFSALCFGSYHVYQGSYSALAVTACGVALGLSYVLLGRLWPFIVGHAMFNLMLTLIYAARG